MSKSGRKRSSLKMAAPRTNARRQSKAVDAAPATKPAEDDSKQSRLLAMLRSSAGGTIAAMMKATGWQQHSVRGFLAGVVRKRLKLKLSSAKVDGVRVYRVASGGASKPAR